MKNLFLTLFIITNTLTCFAGDIVTLNNENQFDCKITKVKKCSVVLKVGNQIYEIPYDDISYLEFEREDSKAFKKFNNMLDNRDTCLNGKSDARNFHGKKGGHVALGFFFGPIAMLGTALANPTPYKGRETAMLSKNQEEFTDSIYLECYRKEAKRNLFRMEAIGWAAGFLVTLIASAN